MRRLVLSSTGKPEPGPWARWDAARPDGRDVDSGAQPSDSEEPSEPRSVRRAGEVLKTEVLDPLGMSQLQLARAIGVPARRINAIIRGERGITVDTAIRMEAYLGIPARYWLELQAEWDLAVSRRRLAKEVGQIRPYAREVAQRAPTDSRE